VTRLGHTKPEVPACRNIRGLYAEVLHIDRSEVREEATFASLGGDSLSYVTLAVRLERILGTLPRQWHTRTIAELEGLTQGRVRSRRWGRSLDTSIVLRTLSILFIIGSHIGLFVMWSGAHVLLGIAGFNFARFSVAQPRSERLRHSRTTVALIAIPTIVWVGFTMVVQHGYYSWTNLLLLNKILGPSASPTAGHLWFVEVLVYFLLGTALLLRIPIVDRLARREPFRFAAALFVVASIVRFHSVDLYPGDDGAAYSPLAYWFFALGMMAATAAGVRHRIVTTVALTVTVPGYFHDTHRELLIIGGLALLIWLPTIRIPAALAGVVVLVADSSLFLYLTHWQVYPLLRGHTLLAWAVCIVVGVVAAKTWSVLRRLVGRTVRRERAVTEPVALRGRVAAQARGLYTRVAA
jgi:hypothetical protein